MKPLCRTLFIQFFADLNFYFDNKYMQEHPIKMKTFAEPFFAEEGDICPHVDSDNPAYSLGKSFDAVALCAETVFGISTLFPWQRLAIANILDAIRAEESIEQQVKTNSHKDPDADCENFERYDQDGILRGRQIVLLPTGAGKSLCFQVPALLLDKPTLVIYPLLALMQDQYRRLKEAGLEPALFRGGQTPEERQHNFSLLKGENGHQKAKLIIANPEILLAGQVLNEIEKIGIAHLAIDEAHCVSEWGDSFRPAYLELASIIKKLNPPAVTAFTATAGDAVLSRISEILFEGRAHIVRGESDRLNISYAVRHCRVKQPALLAELAIRKRPLVIFCATRKETERIAAFLRNTLHDKNIRFYHAGLQREEKTEVEQWFHTHDSAILVTTCAWGMGVDKKNVRTVIHFDPPPTAESYVQEAGRGGRDREAAEAVLLWSPKDSEKLATMSETQQQRSMVLRDFAESKRCRRTVLLHALGEKNAVALNPGDETIACAGCDVCNGTANFFCADEKALCNFVQKNNLLYTSEELVDQLKTRIKYWTAKDFKFLITELINTNILKESDSFFRKKKLTLASSKPKS
nr:RecQ family ATP-dependent DNA helicase [Treponema phagedenis]